MTDTKLSDALFEVIEILKNVSEDDYNKIPEEKIEMMHTYANKKCEFKYNPNKTMDEQGVSEEAKAIIALFFRDYWASEKQRSKMLARQKSDLRIIEEEKIQKYDPNNIFNNKKEDTVNEEAESNTALVVSDTNNEKWFRKIINKIKGIFKRAK